MKKVECITCNGEGVLYSDFESEDIECPDCDNGEVENPDLIVFVNSYKVTRHFGGQEEGGWWYNNYECIESIPVRNKYSKLMEQESINNHKNVKCGDIYSVLGGVELTILIEEKPCESQTTERPYYE